MTSETTATALHWAAGLPRLERGGWAGHVESTTTGHAAACPHRHRDMTAAQECGAGMAAALNTGRPVETAPGIPPAAPAPGTVRVGITFEEVETAPHGRVTVGHVDVGQPDECEREADEWTGDDDSSLRAAAVAWEAVTRSAVFTVNGKTYEASECADWWA